MLVPTKCPFQSARVLGFERGAAAGTEVGEHAAGREQFLALGECAVVVVIVVEQLVLTCDDVVQLGDDGQHLHLEQNGVAPVALEGNVEMALSVLLHARPLRAVAEALEVGEEPCGHVAAFAAHERDLLIGDDDVLEHLDLFLHQVGEALGVDGVVAVDEGVFDFGARVVVDDGAAHRELIQVVVGEMVDNLSHV